MAAIPKQPVKLKLPKEDDVFVQECRSYLGMSQIGGPCDRYLWYYFRHAFKSTFTRKQMRIFERGDIEEERVVRDLKEIHGFDIESTQEEYKDLSGHFSGHSDGVVSHVEFTDDERVVLEVKSMNSKAFAALTKHGLQKSKPAYYGQIVLYMWYEGLERALYIVTNKDNEDRKIFFVHSNDDKAQELVTRAVGIITSLSPPMKIGGPDWHECKWCDAYDICQFDAPINKTCRMCQYSLAIQKGEWHCTLHDREATEVCDNFISLLGSE